MMVEDRVCDSSGSVYPVLGCVYIGLYTALSG